MKQITDQEQSIMKQITDQQKITELLSENLRLQAIVIEQMEQIAIATALFKEILEEE